MGLFDKNSDKLGNCDCGGRDMSKYNWLDKILGVDFGDQLHNDLWDHSNKGGKNKRSQRRRRGGVDW